MYNGDFQVFILIIYARVNFHKSRWTRLGVRDPIYKRACMHIQERRVYRSGRVSEIFKSKFIIVYEFIYGEPFS